MYNVLLKRVKHFTECEKQILDCKSRFRTADFGVRKRFLSQAGEFFCRPFGPANFFYLKSEPEFFFCEVFLPHFAVIKYVFEIDNGQQF